MGEDGGGAVAVPPQCPSSQCACGGGVGAGECVGGVEGGGVEGGGVEGGGVEGGDGGGVQPGANTSYSPHVSGHITAT